MLYNDQMKNRLRRLNGQIGGVLGMMEEERSCKDVVHQLTAIRSALDRVTMYIVGANMEACIRDEIAGGGTADKVVQEAIELLMSSR